MNDVLGVQIEKITGCPKCGNTIDNMTNFCSNCGYSLNSSQQSVDGKESRRLLARKWVLPLVVCLVLILSVIALGINDIREKNYHDEIDSAVMTMLSATQEIMIMQEKTSIAWENAIYNKKDAGDAILNLRTSKEFGDLILSYCDKHDEVTAHIEKLKNPPQKYKEAYEKFKELYQHFREYDASGSVFVGKNYNTYIEEFSKNQKEFEKCISELRLLLQFVE